MNISPQTIKNRINQKQIKNRLIMNINNQSNVREAKRTFTDEFNKVISETPDHPLKNIQIPSPENLRFRYLMSKYPSTVIMDDQPMRDVYKMVMYPQDVAVQILPPGKVEDKTNRDTVVSFFQQFFPETYDLGEKFELNVEFDEDLEHLQKRLAELTQCQNIQFQESERFDNISILNLKNDSPWFKVKEQKVRVLRPRDGSLIIFKNGDAIYKELTPSERNKIKDKESALKGSTKYYQRTEKHLKIIQQDVELEDAPKIENKDNN